MAKSNIDISFNLDGSAITNEEINKWIDQLAKFLQIIDLDNSKLVDFKRKLKEKNNLRRINHLHIKEFDKLIRALMEADNNLKEYYERSTRDVQTALQPLLSEFVKMQILILLEKFVEPSTNCDDPLTELSGIVKAKLEAVNNILMGKLGLEITPPPSRPASESAHAPERLAIMPALRPEDGASDNKYWSMFGGSANRAYEHKYMKYKAKYLELKQSLRSQRRL